MTYVTSAALPSNAHTYRLLIVKEPSTSRHQKTGSQRRQIVLFVSSREMRLCGVSSFSSTTFFTTHRKTSSCPQPLQPALSPSNFAPESASFPAQLLRLFRVVLNGRRTIATRSPPRKYFVKNISIYFFLPKSHCTIDSPPLVILGTGRNAWP